MSVVDSFCPYVGLSPYTEAERDYFFGRGRDQRIIISNLHAAPLTILYGPSGVGKSSILLAGVVPQLKRASRTAVVVLREWQDPSFLRVLKSECINAIQSVLEKPVTINDSLPLDDLLDELVRALGGPIFVLLDQFEEYFLYHPESEPNNVFDSEFARAVNRAEIDVAFLLSLREDGLSKLDRFRTRIPNLLSNTLRLQHLDASAAEEAIRMPLQVYQKQFSTPLGPVAVEDDLVEKLMRQIQTRQMLMTMSGGVGHMQTKDEVIQIETPFLQLVMTRLWHEEAIKQSATIRLSTLVALGSAQEVVRNHLNEVMNELGEAEKEICSRFFERLITPSGSKIAHTAKDLTDFAGDLAYSVPSVLQALTSKRILRAVAGDLGKPSESRYEIYHDVLAPAILDWHRHYMERQKQERIKLDELAQQRAALEQQQAIERTRRFRMTIGGLTALLIVVCLLAIYAFMQQRKAFQAMEQAKTAMMETKDANDLAEQRLRRIKLGITAKQHALSGDLDQLATAYPNLIKKDIAFVATATSLGYKNNVGRDVYEFKISPDQAFMRDLSQTAAFITYKMDHYTFHDSLLATGPDRQFTASYTGWGCLGRVVAVIEYIDPDKPPNLAIFNMCGVTHWK